MQLTLHAHVLCMPPWRRRWRGRSGASATSFAGPCWRIITRPRGTWFAAAMHLQAFSARAGSGGDETPDARWRTGKKIRKHDAGFSREQKKTTSCGLWPAGSFLTFGWREGIADRRSQGLCRGGAGLRPRSRQPAPRSAPDRGVRTDHRRKRLGGRLCSMVREALAVLDAEAKPRGGAAAEWVAFARPAHLRASPTMLSRRLAAALDMIDPAERRGDAAIVLGLTVGQMVWLRCSALDKVPSGQVAGHARPVFPTRMSGLGQAVSRLIRFEGRASSPRHPALIYAVETGLVFATNPLAANHAHRQSGSALSQTQAAIPLWMVLARFSAEVWRPRRQATSLRPTAFFSKRWTHRATARAALEVEARILAFPGGQSSCAREIWSVRMNLPPKRFTWAATEGGSYGRVAMQALSPLP